MINEEVLGAISSVYERNQLILGSELEGFEHEYAQFSGTKFSVGVGNGLDALYISLKLLGITRDDEVIVPAHTYIATWMAVSRAGAKIIPVDVDKDTMLLDVAKVKDALTDRTRAIIPVHLYGAPCDMKPLMNMARAGGISIVEDNAQAHGAVYHGQVTGSFGVCNATSFYPTKNLGALGDGGALTTDDEGLDEKARIFRNYGSKGKFINEMEGTNSRLDELQAAILRVKLRYLEKWNRERHDLASVYLDRLSGLGDISLSVMQGSVMPVFHLFVIRTNRREALKDFLSASGIETMIHYPIAPHLQQVHSDLGFGKGDFPIAESIAKTALSLPLWPGLGADKVNFICDHIARFFNRKE
jgi:dTDP-4-amino-4,6-dideoxygalactose transaminase